MKKLIIRRSIMFSTKTNTNEALKSKMTPGVPRSFRLQPREYHTLKREFAVSIENLDRRINRTHSPHMQSELVRIYNDVLNERLDTLLEKEKKLGYNKSHGTPYL